MVDSYFLFFFTNQKTKTMIIKSIIRRKISPYPNPIFSIYPIYQLKIHVYEGMAID